MSHLTNRLAWAAQDFHSCENYFLWLSQHLKRHAEGPQGLDSGENCFLGLPCTENAMSLLHKTFTMVKTALWISLDTPTGVNKFPSTSTVVKNAFYIFPNTKTVLHELCRTSTVVKSGFYIFPDTQNGLYKGENCFQCSFWHTHRHAIASQDLQKGENYFLCLS